MKIIKIALLLAALVTPALTDSNDRVVIRDENYVVRGYATKENTNSNQSKEVSNRNREQRDTFYYNRYWRDGNSHTGSHHRGGGGRHK
jgi:hypothetical protein